MRKIFFLLALGVLSLSFYQCSSSSKESISEEASYDESEAVEESPMPRNTAKEVSPNAPLPSNLKLEKRANITIDTKETTKCRKQVDSLMVHYQAYIEKEDYYCNYRNSFELRLRVPAASLDSFIASLSGIQGVIVSKSISVTDRTATYTDLSSRKKTEEAMLERYRQMLKSATKVSDLLEIQSRIDEIQMNADITQGRLNKIDQNVNYSVLSLTIEDRSFVSPIDEQDNSFRLSDFGQALANGWHGFVAVIWFLFNIWPLWIVVAIVIYYIKYRKRRKA